MVTETDKPSGAKLDMLLPPTITTLAADIATKVLKDREAALVGRAATLPVPPLQQAIKAAIERKGKS